MAANASSGRNPGEWDSRLGGLSGILFGVLVIATFVTSYNFPAGPSEADATLAQFSSFRTAFLAGDIFIGLAVVFAMPYFVGVRNAFEGENRLLVGTATLLALVGIVVTAVVFIGEAVALDVLSGAYATGGVSKTAAIIVAQAVIGFAPSRSSASLFSQLASLCTGLPQGGDGHFLVGSATSESSGPACSFSWRFL